MHVNLHLLLTRQAHKKTGPPAGDTGNHETRNEKCNHAKNGTSKSPLPRAKPKPKAGETEALLLDVAAVAPAVRVAPGGHEAVLLQRGEGAGAAVPAQHRACRNASGVRTRPSIKSQSCFDSDLQNGGGGGGGRPCTCSSNQSFLHKGRERAQQRMGRQLGANEGEDGQTLNTTRRQRSKRKVDDNGSGGEWKREAEKKRRRCHPPLPLLLSYLNLSARVQFPPVSYPCVPPGCLTTALTTPPSCRPRSCCCFVQASKVDNPN